LRQMVVVQDLPYSEGRNTMPGFGVSGEIAPSRSIGGEVHKRSRAPDERATNRNNTRFRRRIAFEQFKILIIRLDAKNASIGISPGKIKRGDSNIRSTIEYSPHAFRWEKGRRKFIATVQQDLVQDEKIAGKGPDYNFR